MSNKLMLDVDQAGELKMAFRRARGTNDSKWSNELVKSLSEGSTLSVVLDLLNGKAKVLPLENEEELLKNDVCPNGYRFKENGGVERFIFPIFTNQYQSTKDAIDAGKFDHVHRLINEQNFPMRPQSIGRKIIVLYKNHKNDYNYSKIKRWAYDRGLEKPTYEDAFFFGEQYPEFQKNRSIIFPHEGWVYKRGVKDVLGWSPSFSIILRGNLRERRMTLYKSGYELGGRFYFAFVLLDKGKKKQE
jgi:hypothetical protein